MSRLTAAQIIGLGEYLKPEFEPSTLTVSQLLGVLGYHNIPYPQPYTKPKLIQTFNDEIKANAKKLTKERLKKENSIASDDGITDGITGEPVGGRKPAPAPRRSSRRLSRAPAEPEEIDLPRPDPPKRRRSSAQPNLGGSSHRAARTPTVDALAEESEPDEDEEVPVRKVVRSKKTAQAAGSQARRVSQPMAEESGWEDNNIFQSGAESSPARPSPTRPKAPRKSGIARKSRKSMSAPPQVQPSPSPTHPRYSNDSNLLISPPQSKFEPQLPLDVSRETRIMASRMSQTLGSSSKKADVIVAQKQEQSDDELDFLSPNRVGQDQVAKQESGAPYDNEEAIDEQAPVRDGDGVLAPSTREVARRRPAVLEPTSSSIVSRLLVYLLAAACFALTANYRSESAPIGYCEPGTRTNSALEVHKAKIADMGSCLPKNISLSELPEFLLEHFARDDPTDCSLSLLFALPHPTTCTPCPEHASCTQHNVVCDSGYLLKPHPLLFFLPPVSSPSSIKISTSSPPSDVAWKIVSKLTDGLPLFGSVGLPPRCVEDPRRRKNIGKLGNLTLRRLGQERGRKLCMGENGVNVPSEQAGGEAKRWGLLVDELREELRVKVKATRSDAFEEEFNEAIQQLIQWGGVMFSEDSEGKRYVAHKTPELTWSCAILVNVRESWKEWRNSIFGVLLTILGLYAEKLRRAQRYRDRVRAAELVQVALDTLRNQELAHHIDPVTAPQPFLSSLQLRDLILQDEHSIDTRKRIWDQVERVVESNANVRTNLEEVSGGDEMRVWRWVGSTSTGASPIKAAVPQDVVDGHDDRE
ncbi:hypothetical protein PLEOSDRAFT_1110485 [Pleurotus ostreatus PC15]|uniref:Man1/Src1 C-terminal domain-containing protein n=1 Tax=Pleurotus ostreatus (strain PC15) TaxID=1137138 RepID=A0A067P1Y9_PLEO1|nr:hypothetical protein PLEOSDRAFT_1110485 [Pleurotus ostreatus PC15]